MATGAAGPSWTAERDARGVWTLRFDRPGARQNVLDARALEELHAHVESVRADSGATGLVIRSAKPGGFCAGADLRTIGAAAATDEVAAFVRLGQRVFGALAALAVPRAAVVHGVCLGGGLELALACGPILARGPLRIGTPEVRLGLVPAWGAITALPRRVGLEPALDLLLGGEALDLERAVRVRLVNPGGPEPIDPASVAASQDEPVPPGWRRAIDRRRSRIDPSDEHHAAQARLLGILEIGLDQGESAALEAAAVALGDLAGSPPARRAMAAFLDASKSVREPPARSSAE
jgi:3-hydroxyacyl-CoA dehydrogenase/enoyl-CoA hydratase/3-hydroxybutyryl-CoA epimerase